MSTIVCIGSGNMGYALMKGAGNGSNVYFTDVDAEKAKTAADSLKADVLQTNTQAFEKGDFIFLAVKPQVLAQVLAEISPAAKEKKNPLPVLVSMAAGWSIEKIQTAIGIKIPVVRMMPNTPALIGKGMIAIAASCEVTADKIAELENLLGGAGVVDKLEERYMDAVTGLSGSGPAFVYLFIEALADGGVKAGLPRDKALNYAAQTVFGAAAMVKETGRQPDDLRAMVTSPNGTTLAGLKALEEENFRAIAAKAVEAAWKRAVELGS